MEGHVRKRGKGWVFVYELPRGEDGKRRQKWSRSFRTKREAQRALTEVVNRLNQGSYVAPTNETFREYIQSWLEATQHTVRESTWTSYKSNLELHVLPWLGAVPLQKLTPAALNKVYSDLLSSGRRNGKGGLSPRSVRYCHTIIRSALDDAVRWNRVQRNVADQADPPHSASPEMKTWTREQLRRFLETVREERLYAAWLLAATTGMRRGELLGLRWSDLDFEQSRLAVRRALVAVNYEVKESEPKTARGRRSLALDPVTSAALQHHRKRQAEERLAWGPAYEDQGFIFCAENGAPIHPERLSKMFERHCRRAGLPRIRLHDLRHTYATLALAAGVHPKVVSERLGHANISITLDTYSHAIPALQEDAAARVAALIFEGSVG